MSRPLIIILTVGIYIALMLLVSRLSARGADNATFFTGNRNMAWPLVVLAMLTAPISGVTFVSVPGMVAGKAFSYLQMCLGFVIGYFIIAWILVPLFYHKKVVSIYGFLEDRFSASTYKTGAWLFLISKLLGVGVRFLVVCVSLQFLIFEPFHIPFVLNVILTMGIIWFSTLKGGVKTVIFTDTLKCLCLLLSVIICIYFLCDELGFSFLEAVERINSHPSSKIFHFDDPRDSLYFWKQFVAGIFLVVAMTGLDQDMMQHPLSSKNAKASRKNMMASGVLQFFVMILFLSLGCLLLIYTETKSLEPVERSDDLFANVVFHEDLPLVVGIFFVVGLISASYSSVGSALTSLTTSFTMAIIDGDKEKDETLLKRKRQRVHSCMAVVMIFVILLFYYFNNSDAISAVYTLASYSYGPILGLFIFGLFSRRQIQARFIPLVCLLAPVLSWCISRYLSYFHQYETGYELLLINAFITLIGLRLLPSAETSAETSRPSMET